MSVPAFTLMRTPIIALALLATTATAQPPPAPVLGAYLPSIRIEEQAVLGTFLEFNDAQFVFLPDSEGTAELLLEGEFVGRYEWETYDRQGPFYDTEPMQLVWPESDYSALGYQVVQPGSYEIVYHVEGEPFWRMPFEITSSGGGDPYDSDPTFRLDGMWSGHAYILHDTDESGEWQFKLWLHPGDISTDMNAYVRVTRDGQSEPVLVGGSKQARIGFISNNNWGRKDYELMRPGQQNARGEYFDNRPFRANSETLADGDYVLTFYLGDEVYGRYPFTVLEGAIVPRGDQAPGADPMTRIDGGGAATWLVRE